MRARHGGVRYCRELVALGVLELPATLGRSQISVSPTQDDVDRSLEPAKVALAARSVLAGAPAESDAQPARQVAAIRVRRGRQCRGILLLESTQDPLVHRDHRRIA